VAAKGLLGTDLPQPVRKIPRLAGAERRLSLKRLYPEMSYSAR